MMVGKTTAGIDVYFHFYSLRQLIASILLRDNHVAKMTYIPVSSDHNAEIFQPQSFRENPLFGFQELTYALDDGTTVTTRIGTSVTVTVSKFNT